jgi:hypothetical protein
VLDSVIASGNIFTPAISANTTFAVQSSSGPVAPAGYADQSVGTVLIGDATKRGIRFHMDTPALLQSISVYPSQTGFVQLQVVNANSGVLLGTRTVSVNSVSGKMRVPINYYLQGNTTYDIIPVNACVPFDVNVSGVSYPLISPGGPVTILGYVDTTLHTTSDFYNFYDWKFLAGCQSNHVNVQGIVEAPITGVSLNQNGPITFCEGDSAFLSASAPNALYYQWYNQQYQIPFATNAFLNVKKPGSYSVVVSSNSCDDTSATVEVLVPCINIPDPIDKLTVNENETIQYSDQFQQLTIHSVSPQTFNATIMITDIMGRILLEKRSNIFHGENKIELRNLNLSTGTYLIRVISSQINTTVCFGIAK